MAAKLQNFYVRCIACITNFMYFPLFSHFYAAEANHSVLFLFSQIFLRYLCAWNIIYLNHFVI